MGNTIDPHDDWFSNPMNPASPLYHVFNDEDHGGEDDEDTYMDTGSQFNRDNWATTGMDSDYELPHDMAADGGYWVPPALDIPQVTGKDPHTKSVSLFGEVWIYLKKKLLGEPK